MATAWLMSSGRLDPNTGEFKLGKFAIYSSPPWDTTGSINEVFMACMSCQGDTFPDAVDSIVAQVGYLAKMNPIWAKIHDQIRPVSLDEYMAGFNQSEDKQ